MSSRTPTGPDAIDRVGHTLSDKVEAALRTQIISGERVPGSRLNEVEIAAELAVSRGPVREAMQRLARDGLVRLESHRGAFVRSLDAGEVRALFEVRVALECRAAALAAERAGTDEVATLRALLVDSRGVVEAEVVPHYPERLDLHEQIVLCSRNAALQRYLQLVNQELKLVRARSGFQAVRAPQALDEHERVVEAIAARDPHAAAAAMTIHMESALQSTLGLLRDVEETDR
ncbi:GntR family transcriptional regulator [Patulibacter minatonensis]|uniref:GntR family transcriptional regulator n=1 Tax=Patulibacter minatonensis TaxID=298163 RepID=UPI0004B09B7C|nr:GntR family transcriptional regulator [Patulibacter minatonensis]